MEPCSVCFVTHVARRSTAPSHFTSLRWPDGARLHPTLRRSASQTEHGSIPLAGAAREQSLPRSDVEAGRIFADLIGFAMLDGRSPLWPIRRDQLGAKSLGSLASDLPEPLSQPTVSGALIGRKLILD